MDQEKVQLGPLLQLVSWVETNRKQVVIGTGVILVVVAVAWGMVEMKNQKVVASGEALTKALVNGAMASRGIASAESLIKVAAENPGTAAAARALLHAGGAYYMEGKYAEAQAQFQRFISEAGEPAFVPQALLGVAACLEAQGKTDEAIKSYKSFCDRFSTSPLAAQAHAGQARLLAAQGQWEAAMNQYEDVLKTDPNGSLGNEARYEMESLRSKIPAKPAAVTAPSPALSTNALSTNAP